MNRSALLLLASAVRRSSGTSSSLSRVSSTRRPRRLSIVAFRRRASCSVKSFSLVPAAPFDADVVAAVARVDDDGPDGARREVDRRRRMPAAAPLVPAEAAGAVAAAAARRTGRW